MRHTTLPFALAFIATIAALAMPGCGKPKPPPESAASGEAVAEDDHARTPTPDPPENNPAETPPEPSDEPTHPIEGTPPRFTEDVPQFRRERRPDGEDAIVAADPVPLDMILVPGDAGQRIAPFYLGETEVTWAIMESWMYCRDVLDLVEVRRLINEGFRPSGLYGIAIEVLDWMRPDTPVVAATRHTAEMFCVWLSEKTGRRYRLPTPDEFALAIRLGGGCPENPDDLLALGGFRENSIVDDPFFGPADFDDPWADEYIRAASVKSHGPNAMGLYDLLGNAGEWVVEPGGAAYLMGGHYAVPAADMSADWTDSENHDIWNSSYPLEPRMRFWYWGQHHFQGFRLVCEVER